MCQCLLSKPTAMPPWVKKYHVSNTEIKIHGLLASFSNFSLPWSSLVFLGLSCPAPWKHNVSTSICLVSTLAVPQTRCRTLDGQMFILFIGLTWLNWLTCIMHHNAIHCYSAYSACILARPLPHFLKYRKAKLRKTVKPISERTCVVSSDQVANMSLENRESDGSWLNIIESAIVPFWFWIFWCLKAYNSVPNAASSLMICANSRSTACEDISQSVGSNSCSQLNIVNVAMILKLSSYQCRYVDYNIITIIAFSFQSYVLVIANLAVPVQRHVAP